jgi:hypothetical protein
VAPDEPRYDWLRHFPSGYSITHLEMYARSRPRLCTCFYRTRHGWLTRPYPH